MQLFIVGDMVGGGIYALVGQVAAITGGAVWSAFLLALTLALFTAFAYAELVTKSAVCKVRPAHLISHALAAVHWLKCETRPVTQMSASLRPTFT